MEYRRLKSVKPQLYLMLQAHISENSPYAVTDAGVFLFTDSSRWAGARDRGSSATGWNIRQPCGHTRRWTSRIRCSCLERTDTRCQRRRASPVSSTLPQTKRRIWTRGGVLTAAGDLPVGLIAAVVVKFGVGVVQDGPALGMLHGVAVTLVVHLAAPWRSSHQTFETRLHSCTTGNHRSGILTCPDRPQVCRSLLIRSSSRSRRSPRPARYRASDTGSFSWTGWGPGSPATDLKAGEAAAVRNLI